MLQGQHYSWTPSCHFFIFSSSSDRPTRERAHCNETHPHHDKKFQQWQKTMNVIISSYTGCYFSSLLRHISYYVSEDMRRLCADIWVYMSLTYDVFCHLKYDNNVICFMRHLSSLVYLPYKSVKCKYVCQTFRKVNVLHPITLKHSGFPFRVQCNKEVTQYIYQYTRNDICRAMRIRISAICWLRMSAIWASLKVKLFRFTSI